tara:strand:+ start:2812 stop:3102 length:291 start_codon:yes stop_codon:yes gene_type:complete
MKVQVVKDVWGVEIWPIDVKLVYVTPSWFPRYDLRKRHIVDTPPETEIGKEPYWTNKKWNWGRNKPLVTSKECAKSHPNLLSSSGNGARKILDIDL